MNWCTKLQNSFFRVTELITWQTEKLGFHFIYISIYMFHLSVAATEKPQLITWNGINSKQCCFFFYLHCLSIIRLPNLSLIAHTHTHEALLWFTTLPLPKCPRCNYSPSNILTVMIGKSRMFCMPQSTGWEWLRPAPLSHTHTLSYVGWEHVRRWRPPERFASASITFHRVGGSDRTLPTWKPW